MTYPKIIERPYKVYTGVQNYVFVSTPDGPHRGSVEWTYDKSFELESDADAYANRIAEEYEFVKIEKKETGG